jgi:LuxR family maltose regulon positive regulatory protein
MAHDLLKTKLHVPTPRRSVLPRSRLTSRMSGASEVSLTLVSAPAGFGKTTLLSEWSSRSAGARDSTAWVSLDHRDDDPGTFWSYVGAALRSVAPDLGAAAELDAPQAPTQAALAQLLNALQGREQDVQLVLDDYHVITDAVIHEGLAFLLDHLPDQVHVVLATRSDPPLQLARLRARGRLLEVRASDLRFTLEEATTYLRGSMGLPLTERDVVALDDRTEGWAAALQLAALSMQGRDDVSAFIDSFTGDDRYVVDYLAEEVLQRLPVGARRFLLDTCILSRFNGSLCDAVTAQPGGRAALEDLERQNLFVVGLDDQRRWYRYHHLFADVLRARLLDEDAERVPQLHLRASAWHDEHGNVADAVHHALVGEHWELAADLVERAIPLIRRDRHEATSRGWIEALPDSVVRARPLLGISYVGALMSSGRHEGVEARLQDLEEWLAHSGGAPAGDDGPLRTLPGTIAMYRAGQARLQGDVDGTMTHARRALTLAGDLDHVERGAAAALLGLAHWTQGDVVAARDHYVDSIACLQRAGHVADVLGCTIALVDLELARGRLTEAVAVTRRALELSDRQDSVARGTADAHTVLATLLLELGEVDPAVHHLRTAAALGEPAALPQNAYRWRLAKAVVSQSRGDGSAALALLDEAERVYDTDYSPDVRPVAAVRARLLLDLGRPAEAGAWALTRGLSVHDEPSYLHEYEHLTLARLLLSEEGAVEPALDRFLARLLVAAERAGRHGSVLDVLLLQARCAEAQHDRSAALELLRRALDLAEPQRWVRAVVGHGAVVAELLRVHTQQSPAGSYVHHLLAHLPDAQVVVPRQATGPDRLSEREIAVLRLLASDLDGPAIARTLFLSVNTVRTHTKSIYAKLGVNSRRAAVRRAQDLHLLGQSSLG